MNGRRFPSSESHSKDQSIEVASSALWRGRWQRVCRRNSNRKPYGKFVWHRFENVHCHIPSRVIILSLSEIVMFCGCEKWVGHFLTDKNNEILKKTEILNISFSFFNEPNLIIVLKFGNIQNMSMKFICHWKL